jgi:tRNA splicing ligase
MQVLDFMNFHSNWEEILTNDPYNIGVKRDGDYILLKYNQLSSDFSIQIVRECRGSIFYKNENGKYECICRAFDKFGNYGESYVPEIDWPSAVVEEKVDGSLIKVWHHNDKWHVSTNGTIDAYKAEVDGCGLTFGDVFDRAIGDKKFFFSRLNKNLTYMFELVSPETRVVIPYHGTRLYMLSCRDMHTMKECDAHDTELMFRCNISYPKTFPPETLEECLAYVKTMTKDEEGFVVRDKYDNRVKIKSPEYLMAAKLRNNGAITTKRIINMMKDNMIDDFLAYCPAYVDKVDEIKEFLEDLRCELRYSWTTVAIIKDRKFFAEIAKRFPRSDFLFDKFKNPDLREDDWIMSCTTDKILRMIKPYQERYENNGN